MGGWTRLGFRYPDDGDPLPEGSVAMREAIQAIDNRLGPASQWSWQNVAFNSASGNLVGNNWTDFNATAGGTWNDLVFVAPPSGAVMVHMGAEITCNYYDGAVPSGNKCSVNFRISGYDGYWDAGKKNRFGITAFTLQRVQAGQSMPVIGLNPGGTYHLVPQYFVTNNGLLIQITYGVVTVVPLAAG